MKSANKIMNVLHVHICESAGQFISLGSEMSTAHILLV